MLEYFKGNYAWNMAVATLVEDVGTLAEPFEAFTSVEHLSGGDKKVANEAWFNAFIQLGERLERLGDRDLAEGNALTSARKYHRAAMYFTRADRMMSHHDARKFQAYDRVVENFQKARNFGREGVEFVDIPYLDGFMPALLVKAPDIDGKPAPIVFHIQGGDSVKETQWPVLQTYRARGVSLMIVDQPGTGGALRLHGLTGSLESEKYCSVIVDYILGRPDIATDQIGICGISLGGYFAPRAAAFDKRIKACALWGAIPYHTSVELYHHIESTAASLPDFVIHGMWSFGIDDPQRYIEYLAGCSLDGILEQVTCPLYIIHGENDRQANVDLAARAVFAHARMENKKMKIFTKEDGGVEHCQLDNRTLAADTLADWFADIFGTHK